LAMVAQDAAACVGELAASNLPGPGLILFR
jgi:hypothetical protein